MIKKFLILYWHDRQRGEEPWHIFKKFFAKGKRERLDTEYRVLQEDYVSFHRWNKRYEALRLRYAFLAVFFLVSWYYMFVKSELYGSHAALVVKDLNKNVSAVTGLGFLGAGFSNQTQDSMILEEYLESPDALAVLDGAFRLYDYYSSDVLDPLSRLRSKATREEFLEIYRRHLHVVYDEVSGILHLSFLHTDPQIAQKITAFLIAQAEQQLNLYSNRNAEKQLAFVQDQVAQSRAQLDDSTRALEAYQNEHLTLDPTVDAQTRSSIIATLEATLVQKRAEYNQVKQYMSEKSFDLVKLADEIRELERSLKRSKAALSGGDQSRLNAMMFNYEKLKAQVTFDTEVYKQNLVQLEVAKVEANKESKSLVVLTEPNLPDGYSYPDKPRLMATLVVVLLLAYGIVTLLLAIIKDHKD